MDFAWRHPYHYNNFVSRNTRDVDNPMQFELYIYFFYFSSTVADTNRCSWLEEVTKPVEEILRGEIVDQTITGITLSYRLDKSTNIKLLIERFDVIRRLSSHLTHEVNYIKIAFSLVTYLCKTITDSL